MFKKMLANGNPPDDWGKLKEACDAAEGRRLAGLAAEAADVLDS